MAIDRAGELRVGEGEAPEGSVEAAELPLLVTGGNLTLAVESQSAPRHRAAACALPSGRLTFAFSTAASDGPNAQALSKLGCRTVVALDRGSHDEAWLQRAGTRGASVARSEQTALYAVAVPMRPRAFAWVP